MVLGLALALVGLAVYSHTSQQHLQAPSQSDISSSQSMMTSAADRASHKPLLNAHEDIRVSVVK